MLDTFYSTSQNLLTVTVCIPAYNEAANIERVVRGFLSTGYPNLIEVFIADGGSTDGTQDIVKNLALEGGTSNFNLKFILRFT